MLQVLRDHAQELEREFRGDILLRSNVPADQWPDFRLLNCSPEFRGKFHLSLVRFMRQSDYFAFMRDLNDAQFGDLEEYLVSGNTFGRSNSLCEAIKKMFAGAKCEQRLFQVTLIRGLLAHNVLCHVLEKRPRVDYGHRKVVVSHLTKHMAVPYRAKDVPTDRRFSSLFFSWLSHGFFFFLSLLDLSVSLSLSAIVCLHFF